MITITTDEQELKALVQKIQALGDDFSSRRQRLNMLRGGAKIIRDEIRKNTPVADKVLKVRGKEIQPGFARDSIEVKALRKSNALWVGPKKKHGYLAFWLRFLEFGARNRNGSGRRSRRKISLTSGDSGTRREGIGFIKRSVELKRAEATARIIKDAKRLLERIAKKLGEGGR